MTVRERSPTQTCQKRVELRTASLLRFGRKTSRGLRLLSRDPTISLKNGGVAGHFVEAFSTQWLLANDCCSGAKLGQVCEICHCPTLKRLRGGQVQGFILSPPSCQLTSNKQAADQCCAAARICELCFCLVWCHSSSTNPGSHGCGDSNAGEQLSTTSRRLASRQTSLCSECLGANDLAPFFNKLPLECT